MSDGPKKLEEVRIVTVDPEEFNEIVKRVHEMLANRMEKAKEKKETRPTKRSRKNHVEAAKDVHVFSHMIKLIEHMSHEISNLRDMLSSIGEFTDGGPDMSEGPGVPEMYTSKKTSYPN